MSELKNISPSLCSCPDLSQGGNAWLAGAYFSYHHWEVSDNDAARCRLWKYLRGEVQPSPQDRPYISNCRFDPTGPGCVGSVAVCRLLTAEYIWLPSIGLARIIIEYWYLGTRDLDIELTLRKLYLMLGRYQTTEGTGAVSSRSKLLDRYSTLYQHME